MFYNVIMHEMSIYCRMLWLQLYGETAPCSDMQSHRSGTHTQHLNVWSNMQHNNHFTLIMLFLWSWEGKVIIDIETGLMTHLYPVYIFFICTVREMIRWWFFFFFLPTRLQVSRKQSFQYSENDVTMFGRVFAFVSNKHVVFHLKQKCPF